MVKEIICTMLGIVLVMGAYPAQADKPSKAVGLKRVRQEMVKPPLLPEHTQKAGRDPVIVEVRLEVLERKLLIDQLGTEINALTFMGSVPGPVIVVHEGDYVELTLVEPGKQVTIRFKATKPGIFVYHCAPGGMMIPYHVVSGMNGAIMVLPRDGLKDGRGNSLHYDKAYYIGEQDFYVPKNPDGTYMKFDSPAAALANTLEAMKTNEPSHVVFNGRVGALTGDAALSAKVGETVLFLHSQANRDTRPHLIGGHGDYVWERGNFADAPLTDLETWFIAGGSAGAALYTFQQPGLYVYLNHNLIDAILKGAAAHVNVEGEWNNDLLEQIKKPGPVKK